MTATTKNLWQRIVAVMADMGAVVKGGKTTYGERYAFHKIDDVEDRLRPALVTHGLTAAIVEITDKTLSHIDGFDKNDKPRTTWYAECGVVIEIVNADNPEEKTRIVGWGQGLDYSDKGTGKAISYAAKSAYLSAFHLRGQPDSEGDDISRGQKQKPRRTPQQAATAAQAPPDRHEQPFAPASADEAKARCKSETAILVIEAVTACAMAGGVANVMKGAGAKELEAADAAEFAVVKEFATGHYKLLKVKEQQGAP